MKTLMLTMYLILIITGLVRLTLPPENIKADKILAKIFYPSAVIVFILAVINLLKQ